LTKMNLKLRIFIYFAIAAILPSLLFWLFIYTEIDSRLESDYHDLTYRSIQNYVKEIDQFFEKQSKIVDSIAKAYPYIENSDEGISAFLQKQAGINEHFLNLYIVKKNGELITNTGRIMNYYDYTQRTSYQLSTQQQKLVWLEPYDDEISRLRTFGVAVPLYNKNDEIEGVLVANLTYDFINQVITSTELLSNAEILLINDKGDIKFTTSNEVGRLGNIADEDFALQHVSKDILNTMQGTHDIVHNGKNWLCTYVTMQTNDWKVVVLYNANKIAESVGIINQDVYNSIAIFGAGVLLLVFLLSIYLSNSISKPLLKLRDGVQELSLGNLDHTITLKGMDEIKVVADTFNQMSFNLKKSYKDLFNRTEELYEKNEYLQEMNSELEASYEQLGATMEQLNESEEKYRKLVNNISDMVIVLNNDEEIVYVNTAGEHILGYTESQIIGKSLKDIIKDDINQDDLAASYAKDYNEFQLRMTTPVGDVLYLEGSTRRIMEQGRVIGIQAIARDITQRKLMENELHVRYNELQAINKVTTAVTGTLDLDEMLNIVVDQVITASQGLSCLVGMYDDNNEYILKAVKGIKLEDKSIVNVDSTKNQAVKLIENQKYFIMEHHEEGKFPNEYFKMLYREEGFRFTLFNPIVSHDKHIGLISTILKSSPSEELIELITSMGNSIALSIDNAKAYENVKKAYLKTVQSLVSTIEAKDMYTESHSIRVAKYATFIAAELKMDKNYLEDIWVAGVLHDIGKIGISDSILNKKERLTDEEYQLVKRHPEIAYKILSNIGLDQGIMNAVRHHHERFDGKGYPDGLSGENINLMAAIISVADAFDAITSERSYKQPKSLELGIEELNYWKGIQFNPYIVDVVTVAFMNNKEAFIQIHKGEEVKFF
jgi:PAS domain S-box-containing protein/putative nucleotidyltransferase with HDIG domain